MGRGKSSRSNFSNHYVLFFWLPILSSLFILLLHFRASLCTYTVFQNSLLKACTRLPKKIASVSNEKVVQARFKSFIIWFTLRKDNNRVQCSTCCQIEQIYFPTAPIFCADDDKKGRTDTTSTPVRSFNFLKT